MTTTASSSSPPRHQTAGRSRTGDRGGAGATDEDRFIASNWAGSSGWKRRPRATSNSAKARSPPTWTCAACASSSIAPTAPAYHIAPHVFHELGADVIAIGNEPNGFNINKECGATHTDALSRAVRKHRADVGIALDGDGDRLMMSDASGVVMDGDKLIYAIARYRKESGQALGGVVGTLMTNLGAELALKALGCDFKRAKVGDRYVLELMQQNGWLLGGEASGHILCLDKHTTGDGIVSALQVLAALRGTGRSLAEYTRDCPAYPQILLNVRVAKGFKTDGHDRVAQAVAEVEAELGDTGRVVLRASGTEPLIRVMVEGRDEAQVRRGAESHRRCGASGGRLRKKAAQSVSG
jgi:phosphoglucosamine mutase